MNVKQYAEYLLSLPESVKKLPVVVQHSRHTTDDAVDVRMFNSVSHGVVHDLKGSPYLLVHSYADGAPVQADADKGEISIGEFANL